VEERQINMKPPSEPEDENIKDVASKAGDIRKKFLKQKSLKQWADLGQVLLSLVADYISGKYREIPYWVLSAVSLALLYVLNPLDLIPDVFIGVGYLDDVTVLAFCIKLVEKELEKYKQFLANQPQPRPAKEGDGKVIDIEVSPSNQ
jgi:uncharacterized membrane protein YkvA (DUF1232 family)